MPHLLSRAFLKSLFALTAFTLVTWGGDLAAHAQEIKARFVVLGPDGAAIARVITANPACPMLTVDESTRPMQLRAQAETVPQRPTRSKVEDSKPSAFPVTVCDLPLDPSVKHVTLNGEALPLPVKNPQKIIVIGDTGCRMKLSENAFQPCNDPAAWPFKTVSDSAARLKPDLVIHVGDLHYRENACPVSESGCQGSPWGYGYDTFEADFFKPAADLLAAAPWVFVRGNHESCARGGQGWWRFFDPRPLVKGQDCNRAEDDRIGDFSAPYSVPLGGDSSLIVFDSSFVGVRSLKQDDPVYQIYAEQMREADRLASLTPISFYTNHHPILGLTPKTDAKGLGYYPGNAALQSVLEAIRPALLFPPQVQALLAGHVHLFQMASFDHDHPTQFISGNGGSWVEDPNHDRMPDGALAAPGLPVRHFTTTNHYGFMTMQRDHSQWWYEARNRQGEILARCDLIQRIGQCTPNQLNNMPH
jgi:hypothetical protein